MLVETHMLGELHAFRYCAKDPQYALVISHGIASHGGIYDIFCSHHAALGAEIWSYDAPGHGRSTTTRPRGKWTLEEWTKASMDFAEHVKDKTGLPVFTLGSSLGVAAAFSALASKAVTGAILMGSAGIPGSQRFKDGAKIWRSEPIQQMLKQLGRAARFDIQSWFNFDEDYGYKGALEQKRLDPWNTWHYDLASWGSLFTYDPPVPIEANTKPIFYAVGENDPGSPKKLITALADSIAGPVELKIFEGAGHQLMLFHTVPFSEAVRSFVLKHV